MRDSLRIAETPTDINSAKQLIQEHEEKWEDIQTHNDRYSNIKEQILLSCPPTFLIKHWGEVIEISGKFTLGDPYFSLPEGLNKHWYY